MARYSDDPVRHIVTFRVNSEEKKVLEELVQDSGYSVSAFMRRKLQLIRENEGLRR